MTLRASRAGDQSGINYVNFNQDFACISIGTSTGFRVFNCDPFGQCFSTNVAEMLFSTSLIAVVGSSEGTVSSNRKLRIINTKRHATICELTFPTPVLSVKMNRKRLVVVLEDFIYIYDISCMKLLHTIETAANPLAICCLSPSSQNCYVAYPAPGLSAVSPFASRVSPGSPSSPSSPISPISFGANSGKSGNHLLRHSKTGDVIIYDAASLVPLNVVEAHRNQIAALAVNQDGTLLASASERGTIIRVFSMPGGTKLHEFRRGSYAAAISSMNFNSTSSLLCVSSATETVHVFRLGATGKSSLGATEGAGGAAGVSSRSRSGSRSSQRSRGSSTGSEVGMTGLQPSEAPDQSEPQIDTGVYRDGSLAVAQQSKRSFLRLGDMAGVVTPYLPGRVSSLLEPVRDFAFVKLPNSPGRGSVAGFSPSSNYVMVVTLTGVFYVYAIPAAGGECVLVSQYSLIEA